MGKHSLPDSPGFWRAVFIAGLRYLIVVALIAAVGYGVYRLAFSGGDDGPSADETLSPVPSESFLFDDPTPGPDPGEESPPADAVPAGGEIQVLDGSDSPERLAAAERRLEEAGYDVVATGNTSDPYDSTVVVYQPDNQQMGEAIASLLGVGRVEPPGERNLNAAIPVSVILGPDYAG